MEKDSNEIERDCGGAKIKLARELEQQQRRRRFKGSFAIQHHKETNGRASKRGLRARSEGERANNRC